MYLYENFPFFFFQVVEVKIEKGLQLQENHVEKENNMEMQARNSLDCNGTTGVSATKPNMNAPEKAAQIPRPIDGTALHSTFNGESVVSSAGSIEPKIESTSLNHEGLLSKSESSVPKSEDATPKLESTVPKAESAAPKSEGLAPKPESAVPKPESAAPKLGPSMPVSEESALESETTTPRPEVSALKPEDTVPKSEGFTPKLGEAPYPPTSVNGQTLKVGKATDESASHVVKGTGPEGSLDVEMGVITTHSPPPLQTSEGGFDRWAKNTSENDSSAEKLKETANASITPTISDTSDTANKHREQLVNQASQYRETTEKLEGSIE